MTRFEERMLRCLAKIANNTENIAQNTVGYDWEAFVPSEDKNLPEYFACNKLMYEFAAGIINSFKDKGSQGVADFIMLHERRRDIQNALDPDCGQITWSTEDFEAKAEEIEERDKGKLFDRSDFNFALDLMIDRHEANLGILGKQYIVI